MKCDVWVWNQRDDYALAPVPTDDSLLPMGTATWKTHEASPWFSDAQIRALVQVYAEQGIGFEAWCVPLGRPAGRDVENAVTVLGQMRAAGIAEPWLQFDFESEPTANFWKGTADEVWMIYTEVKRQCPWAHLSMCLYQFDPRLGFINVGNHPACERFVTMAYWTDFRETPEQTLSRYQRALAPYGKPIQQGVPGNSTPTDMQRGLQWIKDHGDGTTPIVWRRGTTGQAVWDVIAAFEMAAPAPSPPTPPPANEPSIEEVNYGLISKIVAGEYAAAYTDIGKILGV